MQNLGFLYILAPVLNKLYPEREKRVQSYGRHLEFFNTHPYFANVLVGIVTGLEEEMALSYEYDIPPDYTKLLDLMNAAKRAASGG